MSKPNLTFGKWIFRKNMSDPSQSLSSKGWIDADNESICTVFNEDDGHLLAAAKEMYEALEVIEKIGPLCSFDNAGDHRDAYNCAIKALALARGENIEP